VFRQSFLSLVLALGGPIVTTDMYSNGKKANAEFVSSKSPQIETKMAEKQASVRSSQIGIISAT
jgi:hypothetical protein